MYIYEILFQRYHYPRNRINPTPPHVAENNDQDAGKLQELVRRIRLADGERAAAGGHSEVSDAYVMQQIRRMIALDDQADTAEDR